MPTDDATLARALALLCDAHIRTVQLVTRTRAGARALGPETTAEDEGAAIVAMCEQAKATALNIDHGALKGSTDGR